MEKYRKETVGVWHQWMARRNGYDSLSVTLLLIYVPLELSAIVFTSIFIRVFAIVCLLLATYRAFSKDLVARQKENLYFVQTTKKIWKRISQEKAMMQDRSHCYFRCPDCNKRLRVPKGKGTLKITCNYCKKEFQKKT